MVSKKGDMLTGEVIFLILNVIILTILVIFVLSKTNGAALTEEQYAKEIALLIDSAKPGMILHLNMEDALKKAVGQNQNIGSGLLNIVQISGNTVTVKLSDKGGYSYSFFNEVNVSSYPDPSQKEYIFIINDKSSGA